MLFKALATKAKDAALQRVAAWVANRFHLHRLGKVTTLKLDSVAQEIFVIVDLHGETSAVELTVRYRILDPTQIEVTDVQASREWMTAFANDVLPAEQKRFTVSPMVTKALTRL
jgi:hypothetical protein